MKLQPRSPILAISLKLYFTPSRTLAYLTELVSLTTSTTTPSNSPQLFYIPDFLPLSQCISTQPPPTSHIHYGAQDGHWEDSGPWTGEVSMSSLREIGCELVELGHAERRRYFNETDEVVGLKCSAAIRNGLVPIVCIGEKEECTVEEAMEVLKGQLQPILLNVAVDKHAILAYEPVWAIGKPRPAPTSYITGVGKALRRYLREEGREGKMLVLYGGSAGPGLWGEIKGAVDGMFLGRFAHEIGNVKRIMEEMEEGRRDSDT